MAGPTVHGDLPTEVTSFIGRRHELGEVKRLLAQARLVTLIGIGGTGKTRLAARAAAQVRRAFPHGVWFVDLAELHGSSLPAPETHDPDRLAYQVAATLGLDERGGATPVRRLTDHLDGRRVLLVLDNCEHLLPACAVLVDRLARGCHHLRILATSREPLAVVGEALFAVPPLSSPEPGGRPDPAGLERYEAVALFRARARAATADFELTAGNQAAVVEICGRLDGLPLAIELAAARARVLTPGQILDRLTDRFGLLSRGSRGAPARQQTLRACMDWSFELCGKPERMLWARLSVFVGGFELDAVEGICADDELPATDLLDLVAGLLDKSVVVRDDPGQGRSDVARYRMLETIRDFGRDRLAEAGNEADLRGRHADWHLRLVDRAAAEWISARQEHWAARLNREHPNLRAAVEFCLAEPGRGEAAMRVGVTVPVSHWFTRGNLSEVRSWLGQALAQRGAPSAVRAGALLFGSHLAIAQGDREAGIQLLKEGEQMAARLDATVELATAAYIRGMLRLYEGDLPGATAAFGQVATVLSRRPQPEQPTELQILQRIGLGAAAALAGDHDRADACVRDLLAITELRGESRYRSFALWARAVSAWRTGRARDALTSLAESLRLKQIPGFTDRFGTARCVEVMAWVAAHQQHHERAATLLGVADAVWTETGTPIAVQGHLNDDHEACERQVRAALGDAAFAVAFGRGRSLSREDALAYALDERRRTVSPAPEEHMPLTRREQQVAGLIAEGLSNKEIAGRLVISQRTAESHVEHILAKLGFTSRSKIAAWLAAR